MSDQKRTLDDFFGGENSASVTSEEDVDQSSSTEPPRDDDGLNDPADLPGRTPVEPDIVDLDGLPGNEQSESDQDSRSQQSGSESNGVSTQAIADINSSWTTFFPYEHAYDDQVDGIEAFLEALGGYNNMVMEGACGTGKTLIGLTAGITAVRNGTHGYGQAETTPNFGRVLITTPVKQQLRQFIDEVRGINRQLDDDTRHVDGIVMRGKQDLVVFGDVDYAPFDEYTVGEKHADLKEKARSLIRFGSKVPLDWEAADITPPDFSRCTFDWQQADEEAKQIRDEHRFDPYRAEAVVELLRQEAAEDGQCLSAYGHQSPYPDRIPQVSDVTPDEHKRLDYGEVPKSWEGYFDPFYIGIWAHDGLPVNFTDGQQSVLDSDDLRREAIPAGVCPHEAMSVLISQAEVVIGNYYHVLDPETRLLTDDKAGLIDEQTVLIMDESHNLESIGRDILSDQLGLQTIQQAKKDLELCRSVIGGNGLQEFVSGYTREERRNARNTIAQQLEETVESINRVVDAIEWLEGQLLERAYEALHRQYDLPDPSDPADETVSLEDPTADGIDELTADFKARYGDEAVSKLYRVCDRCQLAIEAATDLDRSATCGAVGEFVYRWDTESHLTYFREIELERQRKSTPMDQAHQWTQTWTPRFQLFNCIPTRELRAVFSEVGSTLLMSATLAPLDTYVSTTGIEEAVSAAAVDDRDERRAKALGDEIEPDLKSTVIKRQYPLEFPPENRGSWVVDLPKFTSSNRGRPTTSQYRMTETRQAYADTIKAIAKSPGNVLLCMPSYREAEWAASLLESTPVGDRKHIFLDRSSDAEWTDKQLEQFFTEDEAVAITSIRGTITEGVDYDGTKLSTCAVIGVSIVPPTDRQKAIETAYEEELDVNGFEITKKVPAVRKARQAIGRVIRGDDEVGTRLLVDERYGSYGFTGVAEYLSPQEENEFDSISGQQVDDQIQKFWNSRSQSET